MSTVVGYQVTEYDVRSLSQGIITEVDRIEDQLREVRASEVTSADLGSEVGASYVRVVHGSLADSLAAFQSAGERLAETLIATFEHYQEVDQDSRERFDRLGEDVR